MKACVEQTGIGLRLFQEEWLPENDFMKTFSGNGKYFYNSLPGLTFENGFKNTIQFAPYTYLENVKICLNISRLPWVTLFLSTPLTSSPQSFQIPTNWIWISFFSNSRDHNFKLKKDARIRKYKHLMHNLHSSFLRHQKACQQFFYQQHRKTLNENWLEKGK